MDALTIFLIVAAVLILLPFTIKIVKQYERGVVLRFGRLVGVRQPGFNVIIPFVDRMTKVTLRIVPFVLEPQEIITKDNVTVRASRDNNKRQCNR
jgi:regulator of protease activity HflC (stomatin/prohibitin superfamily)